eukprot:6205749-Pleurochrysis_carterae.AAC.3
MQDDNLRQMFYTPEFTVAACVDQKDSMMSSNDVKNVKDLQDLGRLQELFEEAFGDKPPPSPTIHPALNVSSEMEPPRPASPVLPPAFFPTLPAPYEPISEVLDQALQVQLHNSPGGLCQDVVCKCLSKLSFASLCGQIRTFFANVLGLELEDFLLIIGGTILILAVTTRAIYLRRRKRSQSNLLACVGRWYSQSFTILHILSESEAPRRECLTLTNLAYSRTYL